MENNEKKSELLVNNDIPNYIFKLDYVGQKLENNKNYKEWKNSILSKYGNNAKISKCFLDNILFYSNDIENKDLFFQTICPICNNPICNYCYRNCVDSYYERASCCIKRKIKYIFYRDSVFYINYLNEERIYKIYKKFCIIFFIPIISFLYFVARIQTSFFYKMPVKKFQINTYGIINYANYLNYKYLFLFINIGTFLVMIIPFFILHIYFILFVIIISAPFKSIPLKSIIGILYGRFVLNQNNPI